MINLKQELLSYPPIDVKSLLEGNPSLPDNVINSIVLYNKALENLKMNSEDIAIIELKKAVSMNPNFYEAMNLLGVCYIYTREYSKALEVFERVAANEKNGVKALNYIRLLKQDGQGLTLAEGKKKAAANDSKKSGDSKKDDESNPLVHERKPMDLGGYFKSEALKYLTAFLVGAALMFLLSFLFSQPSKYADVSRNIGEKNPAANAADTSKEDSYEREIKKLSEDYERLQAEAKASRAELDYYKNASKLFEVEKLFAARNNEAAADILVMLKTVNFREPEKSKYESLYNNIIPKAAWTVFNEGNALLGQKKYREALDKLGKVQVYGTDWLYMDITLYNMGICYKELNDSRNALDIFQRLIAQYPRSQYAQYAQYRINELRGQP